MEIRLQNIGIIGSGAWGTALACSFNKKENITIWSYEKQTVKQINKYKINKNLLKKCPRAIFLHCLPRGSEVDENVFKSKQSKVWLQALNRVHVQKSILLYCLGKLR